MPARRGASRFTSTRYVEHEQSVGVRWAQTPPEVVAQDSKPLRPLAEDATETKGVEDR